MTRRSAEQSDQSSSESPASGSRNPSPISRRAALTSGLVGAAMLAGCFDPEQRQGADEIGSVHRYEWDDDDPPTDVHVDGRTLTIHAPTNPETLSPLWDLTPLELRLHPYEPLYRATNEPGLWGRWWSRPYWMAPGRTFPQLYEDVEIEAETVTVRIRDDAFWSDGEPITAVDAVAPLAVWRAPREPVAEVGWTPGPNEGHAIDAVGSYELPEGRDGRVVEYHLQDDRRWREAGGFEAALDRGELLYWLGGPTPRMGVRFPVHVEPYRSVAEEALADFEELAPGARDRLELIDEHVSEDDVDRLRDGEAYVSSGVWTLDEIVGTQRIVLKPNEHHRHFEDVNFDSVVFEVGHQRQVLPDFRFERRDYGQVWMNRGQLGQLPDAYEYLLAPHSTGRALSLDHSGPLGDVRVRQALQYAIDTVELAAQYDPADEPVLVPGGDLWGIHTVLEDQWIGGTLRSYERDLDRAAELLWAAGYERDAGGWWRREGSPLRLRLHTRWGDSITAMLDHQLSEFGIELDVYAIGETIDGDLPGHRNPVSMPGEGFGRSWPGDETDEYLTEEYEGAGGPDAWAGEDAGDGLAGTFDWLVRHWTDGLATRGDVRARNYFDHDSQETALQKYGETGWVEQNHSAWVDWTIEVPPIGDPDGDPEPFAPAYTAGRVLYSRSYGPADPQPDNPYYDPPRDEPHEENAAYFWKQFAWVCNWWLPVLPIHRFTTQHFRHGPRWIWPRDIPGEDNEYMSNYFGDGWATPTLVGMNKVLANPDH